MRLRNSIAKIFGILTVSLAVVLTLSQAFPVHACVTDYSSIDGNLIPNPYFECDDDANGIPDGWSKRMEDANHVLSVVDDPTGGGKDKVLKSEYIDNGNPDDFGWLTANHITLDPNTWYQLTITYFTENTGLALTDNKIDVTSNWLGASIGRYTSGDVYLHFPASTIFPPTQHFATWDNTSKVFRTYSTTNSSGWQTKTIYFQSSQFDSYAVARTFHYPPGTFYLAEFIFKKTAGNTNPTKVAFNKAGTLSLFTHQGSSFFPIILKNYPHTSGQDLDIDQVKAAGFNTVPDAYRNYSVTDYQTLLSQKNLAVDVSINCLPWSNEYDCFWSNDPTSIVNYLGYSIATSHIDDWKNYDGVFMFESVGDEIDCQPQSSGSYPGYLNMYQSLTSYVNSVTSKPTYGNYCGNDSYTNDFDDKLNSYLILTDIFTDTTNTENAYDIASGNVAGSATISNAGYNIRQSLSALTALGLSKKAMAFAMGTYWWSSWNGDDNSLNEYVPFNLQRYQVWDQIINGATGVIFHAQGVNLDDTYYSHSFDQIKTISSELQNLSDVLLEPRYYDEWTISDEHINAMMKKHDDKIYLFTVSTSQQDLQDVTITLDSTYQIDTVTALGDVTNGDYTNPTDRTLTTITANTFTDDFVGESATSPQGYNAPGYDTHIYLITYHTTSSAPEPATSSSTASTPTPISTPTPCTDTVGTTPTHLYKAVAESSTKIKLYFTKAADPISRYVLAYGTESDKYQFGVPDIGITEDRQLSYQVDMLSPGKTYYFRLRSDNGCATGPWSNELSVTTLLDSPNKLNNITTQIEEKVISTINQIKQTNERIKKNNLLLLLVTVVSLTGIFLFLRNKIIHR